MNLLLGAAAVAALLCFGLLKWRWALWGALLLVVLEGALRKWFLPGYEAEIFFLKDFLLLGAYWTYFIRLRLGRGLKPFRHHMANGLLAITAALCTVQAANPRLPSLFVGLLGLQNYLFYVPLMYMVPDLFPDRHALQRFVYGVVAVALVPLLLGPIQFVLPPDHRLNQYAHSVDYFNTIATFGGENHARVTATFPYITGFTVYLDAMFLLALALILLGPGGWFRKMLYLLLGLTVANLLMTGSRAPVLYAALCAPVMVLLAASSMKARDLKIALLAAFLLPVLLLGVVKVFPEALAAFIHRVETSRDAPSRLRWFIENPVWATELAGLKGWGTGATYRASYRLSSEESYNAAPDAEGEWERIILEVGVAGLPLILLTRVLVCLQLWKAYQHTQQAALRPLLLAGLAFTAICFPGNLVMHHSASILYYFCAGLAFLSLPAASLQRQRAVPVHLRQPMVVSR